jgi:D-cysteine desulfhydrase
VFSYFDEGLKLPHLSFCDLPTPLLNAPELAEISGAREFWIKRDDLTARPYGGNKVRKLEFLLGYAKAKGFKGVWTGGGVGSNHCLATAIYGSMVGLSVNISHFAQPPNKQVLTNCLALAATGASIELVPMWSVVRKSLNCSFPRGLFQRSPDELYKIPLGGSSPVGILGYVNGGLEIAEQVRRGEMPTPDLVVAAAGTGGTIAGLAVGLGLAGIETALVGVRVVSPWALSLRRLRRMIHQTCRHLSREVGQFNCPGLDRISVRLDGTALGGGYGHPTEEGGFVLKAVAQSLGIPFDLTYTGKALGAMLNGLSSSLKSRNVLYVHTLNSLSVSDLVPEHFSLQELPDLYRQYFSA